MSAAELCRVPVTALSIADDFRLDDDAGQLAELAASIAEHGVLQPLLVRETPVGLVVVGGRRRLAAARVAGLDKVPCVVQTMTDDEAMDTALAENLHRRNLSPIEEGLAYARMKARGLTQMEIARRVGVSDFKVSVLLQILELPARVRNAIHEGRMTTTTAYRQIKEARGPTGHRQGGTGRGASTNDEVMRAVNHWRRRHDRLLAGVHALYRSAQLHTSDDYRGALRSLVRLDAQPFQEDAKRQAALDAVLTESGMGGLT